MKRFRLPRLVVVVGLVGMAVGLGLMPEPGPAGATGSTPRIVLSPINARFIDVDGSNDGLTAYTVAQPGGSGTERYDAQVVRTINGGLDWTTLSNSPEGRWNAVSTTSTGATVAVVGETAAGAYRLFVSIDSGDTWAQKGPTTSSYLDVAVSGDGSKIVVAQDSDGVSYSTDGGDSWMQATTSANTPLLADDVAVNGNGSIMVVSKFGGSVWRSIDGGATWTDIGTSRHWDDISISDDGATVFGVVRSDKGYIWTAEGAWVETAALGFTGNIQQVRGAISPNGRTFLATRYGDGARILRNWDPTYNPATLAWTSNSTGNQALGLTVIDEGSRFTVVNESSGIRSYVPSVPAPIVSEVTDRYCFTYSAAPTGGGTRLSIFGRHLFDATVTIGGSASSVNYTNDAGTEIQLNSPAGSAGPADIVITTPAGSVTSSGSFTFHGDPQDWSRLGSTIEGISSGEYSGFSVAISTDGSTMTVGSYYANSSTGLVRVFRWSGNDWMQLGATLPGTDAGGNFGWSVALDADGSSVAIGAPFAADDDGQVSVYDLIGNTWTLRGNRIIGGSNEKFGRAVALSANGNTVVGSAPSHNSSRGLVRVVDWATGSWVTRGSVITGDSGSEFGSSLAMSADGNTVAVGAPISSSNTGQARVYDWNVDTWLQRGPNFTGEETNDYFGQSIALSADGNTVAIGAPQHESARGQVRVYDWANTTWTQVGPDIDDGPHSTKAGTSIALSSNGNILAYTSPSLCRNGSVGSITIKTRVSNQWIQRGGGIDSPIMDSSSPNYFGTAIAMSGNGEKVVGSNRGMNSFRGSVFAWRYTPPIVSTPPVFVVPPSSSAPSTSTPGTTVPAPVEPPAVDSVGSLPVGDPAALFGRAGGPGGLLPLRIGEQLNVTLNGFTANEDVWIGLFSNPVTIATVKADTRGVLSTAFTIPSGITGDHTLVIYGTESGNGVRIPVRLVAPTLPATGPTTTWPAGMVAILATLILTLGLSLVIWVYKRTLGVLS